MDVQRILVVGGGIMGSGIAQVTATAGYLTTVVEPDAAARERAVAGIDRSLARLVKAGRLTAEAATEATGRITFDTTLERVAPETDHVIEAIPEVLAVKQQVLRRLDELCRDDVILASNTSQIPIGLLAAATRRPDRVIGTHWFSPPPVMRLIEVVRGFDTSEATVATTLALATSYGKETILCKRDTQGFVTSRLMMILSVEAARIVEEGIADAEDVNRACVLAFNHAMGPLDTVDLGGLDTMRLASEGMAAKLGDRFRAPQILHELVNAGHLGRKSGRGFRSYEMP